MKTSEYLAAIKAKRNISSDYKLAKHLGISTQLMAKYTKGLSIPGPLVAFKIAEILGEQPAAVIADLEAERAEKMGKNDDAAEWHEIMKRLAASILLAVGVGGFPNADAGLRQAKAVDPMHIALHKRKRRRSSTVELSAAA